MRERIVPTNALQKTWFPHAKGQCGISILYHTQKSITKEVKQETWNWRQRKNKWEMPLHVGLGSDQTPFIPNMFCSVGSLRSGQGARRSTYNTILTSVALVLLFCFESCFSRVHFWVRSDQFFISKLYRMAFLLTT